MYKKRKVKRIMFDEVEDDHTRASHDMQSRIIAF